MAIGGISGYGVSAYGQTVLRGAPSGIAGVPAPEFGPDKMYTKTRQTRSDEKIREDIVELAKKDAARGVNGFGDDFGRESAEYKRLAYEYITPYSPDRKTLFGKRMKEISDGLKPGVRTVRIDTSAMDAMLNANREILGGEKETKGDALEKLIRKYDGDLGGNTVTGEVKMIAFRDGNQRIGSWSQTYGWGYQPTDAEIARRVDVANLYLETWKKESGVRA